MAKLESFLYEDDSYGNDEVQAILVYLSKECAIRITVPSDHYEGYTLSQSQEECSEEIADYLEQFDGDEFTEEEIVKILTQINR